MQHCNMHYQSMFCAGQRLEHFLDEERIKLTHEVMKIIKCQPQEAEELNESRFPAQLWEGSMSDHE